MDIFLSIEEYLTDEQTNYFKEHIDINRDKLINIAESIKKYHNRKNKDKLWKTFDIATKYYCDANRLNKEYYVYIIKCYEEPEKIPFGKYDYIITCPIQPMLVKNTIY